MTKLAATPEWLEDSVQHKDTCWSAKEGFEMCEDGEAYWEWDALCRAMGLDDFVACPDCADSFLSDKGRFSNGVLCIGIEWDFNESTRRQHIMPFAKRQARSYESCDLCTDEVNQFTVFIPELGGWVAVEGDTSPSEDDWLAHARELSPRVLGAFRHHGINWALDLEIVPSKANGTPLS